MATITRRVSGAGGLTPVTMTPVSGVLTPDAARGNGPFKHIADTDVTLAAPTSGRDGQEISVMIKASGGPRTLSFPGGTPSPVVISGGVWWVGHLIYSSGTDEWVLSVPGSGTGGSGTGAVDSVSGKTGVVVLTADDIQDGTTNRTFTATEKTKLSGVATAATANSTDAQLRDRSTHTGTQPVSSLTATGTASSTTYLRGDGAWATPSGAGSGYSTMQDEGTARTQRATLNFTGSGVVVTDDAANSRTNVAISGTSVSTPWTYVAPGDSVQDAIDGGAKAIQLGAGNYAPFSLLGTATAHTRIQGLGLATVVIPSGSVNACITIGNGTDAGKTWGVNISDLVCDANGVATNGMDWNIQAASQSSPGFYQGEPDSMCRVDNVWIYDALQVGLYQRGLDLQAMVTSRCRIRRSGTYGCWINNPDSWWHHNEATGGNSTGAAWRIEGANTFFSDNKGWFGDNYGFWCRATRCRVQNCEAQDNGSHGFFVDFSKITLIGCMADQNGYNGGVDNTVDGFNVAGSTTTNPVQIVGCQSFNRMASTEVGQRYGFNVPTAMNTDGYFVANAGYGNKTALNNFR